MRPGRTGNRKRRAIRWPGASSRAIISAGEAERKRPWAQGAAPEGTRAQPRSVAPTLSRTKGLRCRYDRRLRTPDDCGPEGRGGRSTTHKTSPNPDRRQALTGRDRLKGQRERARVAPRQHLGRRGLIAVALVLAGLPVMAAACAFDSQIAVQFRRGSPAVVKESFKPEQSPHRVQGTTTRGGQVAGIDCSITIIYDIREAAGSTSLAQSDLVHLRTLPLPSGTTYELDCTGPLIVEIPTNASAARATRRARPGGRWRYVCRLQ
jgi:hypothetical protein